VRVTDFSSYVNAGPLSGAFGRINFTMTLRSRMVARSRC
jgi:hypothetical protein